MGPTCRVFEVRVPRSLSFREWSVPRQNAHRKLTRVCITNDTNCFFLPPNPVSRNPVPAEEIALLNSMLRPRCKANRSTTDVGPFGDQRKACHRLQPAILMLKVALHVQVDTIV